MEGAVVKRSLQLIRDLWFGSSALVDFEAAFAPKPSAAVTHTDTHIWPSKVNI